MDKLIEFAIQEWPGMFSILVLIAMILLLIITPLFVFWWFQKFISRDRYVFAQDTNRLYCLDTVTGKIKVARGFVFQEVSEWDKVEAKKDTE